MTWTANEWHSRRTDTHIKGTAVMPYEYHIIKTVQVSILQWRRLYYTKIKPSLTASYATLPLSIT